jgi:hypothetical protein
MNALRNLTGNINTIVQFFRSINCLFWNLEWLERNIVNGSSERIIMVLIIVGLVGYMTFACSSDNASNEFCGGNGVSSLIFCAAIGVIVYFFYKRYRQRSAGNSGGSASNESKSSEREQFIPVHANAVPVVAPYEQLEMGNMVQPSAPNGKW